MSLQETSTNTENKTFAYSAFSLSGDTNSLFERSIIKITFNFLFLSVSNFGTCEFAHLLKMI